MADVLTQPATLPDGLSESRETLVRSLDDILGHYLSLLDQYQRLQQKLTRHLSEGFFSLAQANFTSPNRIHYGQDFYDDRMQASVPISCNTSKPYFAVAEKTSPSSGKPSDTQPQSNLEVTIPTDDSTVQEKSSMNPEVSKTPSDPLNWFGILVPQALRTAQSHFSAAVMDEVAQLVNIRQEMVEVEAEVRRLRGTINDSL
ncbi:MAG: hypothetical protein Q9187_002799 [Circinaria calcarea]